MNVASTGPSKPISGRRPWQPVQVRYIGQVGDIMRGQTGTKKDFNNSGMSCNNTSGSTGQCQ